MLIERVDRPGESQEATGGGKNEREIKFHQHAESQHVHRKTVPSTKKPDGIHEPECMC